MMYRSIGGNVELIDSDFDSVKIVLASKHLVKEYIAFKNDDDIILADDDNIEYYSVLNKKGLGSWKSSLVHAASYVTLGLAGTLVSTTTDILAGGKNKEKVIFIKFKNGHHALIIIKDGYNHLLRSRKKVKKDAINDEDLKWIRHSLDEHPVYI